MSNTSPSTVDLELSEVFWFNEDNAARSTGLYRDEKDEHSLVSLLFGGWDGQLGRPAVRKLTEDERKVAKSRLEETYSKLQSADLSADAEKIRVDGETISITMPEMLRVFEQVHTRNGKIVVPKYKGATCFRRGNALLKTNTARAKKGMDPITVLPCVVREYASTVEQYIDNVRENQMKTAGARRMSNADSVGAARKLFQLGASESKLAKAFGLKRGMAQKFHRLCKLDAAHPDLRIVDRIIDPNDDLSDKPFDKEKVKGLLDKGADAEEVKAFIAAPNAGNASKIMSRKEIEALEKQCPVKIVKLTLQAILKNDAAILASVIAQHEAINKATEAFTG
jgi:hypothetical protein